MVEGLLAGAGLEPPVRAEVKVRQWGRRPLLPYEVRGIEWHTPPTTTPGVGLPYQAHPRPDPPDAPVGLRVFHLEATDPNGQPAREYDANLLAPGGQVADRVELGLNARPGPWQLTLRDVTSGPTAAAAIQVEAGIDSPASPGGEGPACPAWTGPTVNRCQF